MIVKLWCRRTKTDPRVLRELFCDERQLHARSM